MFRSQSASVKSLFLMFWRNFSNKMHGLNLFGYLKKTVRSSLILTNKVTVTVILNKQILLLPNQIQLFIHIIIGGPCSQRCPSALT